MDLFRPFRLDPLPNFQPGTFHLRLEGPRGMGVHIERSGDLVRWEDWQTATLSGDSTELTDDAASSLPNRFYRAVWK
jgi:hypothetical protein